MKFSIITVNYNDKAGLQRTIKSVLTQAYENIEFIIIDGGSTDGGVEIIKEYESKIDYWVSEKDKGIYNAMNKGVAKATGDYLLFLNSGDDFFNDKVLCEVANQKCTQDILYGNVQIVSDKKEIVRYPSKLTFNFFFKGTIIHQGVFFKKKCFDLCGGYDEELKIVADWKVLILSLCRYNLTYKYIDILLVNFYADGVSSNPANFSKLKAEFNKTLQEEFPMLIDDYKHYGKLKLIEHKVNYIRNPMNIYSRVKEILIKKYNK